jgi:MFS family permease
MHTTNKPSAALKFVLMIGVLSFFADFTYEGSRSILGPYLALLQASGTAVAVVTGFGELLGYGLRLVSGPLADRTGKFWPITIFGYVVQIASVPLLALAGNWPTAAVLIILERVGKAIRNPPRDVMLSHAAKEKDTARPSVYTRRSTNSERSSDHWRLPLFWHFGENISSRLRRY